MFPWKQFEAGQISVDEIGKPRENFDYNKKPYLITFNGLDDIDKTSLEKIKNELPRTIQKPEFKIIRRFKL